jgi:hypothetical protein
MNAKVHPIKHYEHLKNTPGSQNSLIQFSMLLVFALV